MGRKFFMLRGEPLFLKSSTVSLSVRWYGIYPFWKILNRCENARWASSGRYRRVSLCIPSGPAAFPSASRLACLPTMSAQVSVGMSRIWTDESCLWVSVMGSIVDPLRGDSFVFVCFFFYSDITNSDFVSVVYMFFETRLQKHFVKRTFVDDHVQNT